MNPWLATAAVLAIALGVAHSVLGERYILVRLFRRPDLPRLFGGDWFTRRTLRFAWHLTSVTWAGFAAILLRLGATAGAGDPVVHAAVAATFLLSAGVAAVASRGRHLSWPVFLAIAALTWLGR